MTGTRLITGVHASQLLGVSAPTFYRMAADAPEGSPLRPLEATTNTKMWSLNLLLVYIAERDIKEADRRRALVAEWTQTPSGS